MDRKTYTTVTRLIRKHRWSFASFYEQLRLAGIEYTLVINEMFWSYPMSSEVQRLHRGVKQDVFAHAWRNCKRHARFLAGRIAAADAAKGDDWEYWITESGRAALHGEDQPITPDEDEGDTLPIEPVTGARRRSAHLVYVTQVQVQA